MEGYRAEKSGVVFRGDEAAGTVEVPGYEITDVVSAGANGIVFAAEHQHLEREVAIKVYPPRVDKKRQGGDPYEQARAESDKVAALRHDGLAVIYDFGVIYQNGIPGLSDGWPYCVMEYRAGQPLRDVLADMAEDFAGRRSALRQIFDVLTYAEKRGCLHGDLHKGNVLVERFFGVTNVSVVDFGTSIFAAEGFSEARHARKLRQTTFQLLPELKAMFVPTPRLAKRTGFRMLPALVAALDLYDFVHGSEQEAALSPRGVGQRLADAVDFDLDVLWAVVKPRINAGDVQAVKQAFAEFLTHEHELEYATLTSDEVDARLSAALAQYGAENTII